MTQKTIETLINEIYSRAHKKNYSTNKSNVYYNIETFWSLHRTDENDGLSLSKIKMFEQ